MSLSWMTVFKRRRQTLENYLIDCNTIEDAVAKFHADGLSAPSINMLQRFIHSKNINDNKKTILSNEETDVTPIQEQSAGVKTIESQQSSNDQQQNKYDDIIIINTDE